MSALGGVDLLQAALTWGLHRRDSTAKAAQRRRWAIAAYTGANGGGKTLAMIHDTLPTLDAGRPVLSTVRLLDFRNPRPCDGLDGCDSPEHHEGPLGVHAASHPLYVPFTDFRQLLEFEAGDVLMDEVTGVASSRESHAMPVQVVNFLMQLRRRDILLRWTAPSWARADKVIREVTQAVTDCQGSMPVTRVAEDGTARQWRDRRLFRWTTFDAFDFDEFSTHKRDTLNPLARQHFWRPGSVSSVAYDTLDPVLALGAANDAGICMTCGGRRSIHKCECGIDHDARPVRSARRRERPVAEVVSDLAASAVWP